MVAYRDYQDILEIENRCDPIQGFPDQAFSAEDLKELFWPPATAEWPEACPSSSCHNDCVSLSLHCTFLFGEMLLIL